jgi:predicted glycosyltransferase involved in capsule biosynthesis
MVTDRDISFIAHVKIDNELRRKNLIAISKFYQTHFPNSEFIGIEEGDGNSDTNNYFTSYSRVRNDGLVRKTLCYNEGAILASRKILVFIDIDIVVNPEYLLDNIQSSYESNTLDCMIGYNGTAIYLNESGEKDFLITNNIDDLYSKIEGLHNTNDSNAYGLVGNTQAVGGCLVMTRDSFNKINGFNPFFKGWGYEDNEIISRAHKLGLNVTRSNIKDDYLFHLPHSDLTENKSAHHHYNQNHAIVNLVESLNDDQIKTYIKQW